MYALTNTEKRIFSLFRSSHFLFLFGSAVIQDEFVKGLPLEEWSKAGASIAKAKMREVQVAPGVDLGKVIEKSKGKEAVVIKLKPGKYYLSEPLQMQSKVYLEGVDRESVQIISTFKRPFYPEPFDTPCSIEFQDLEESGLRNLSLSYEAVDFEPF